MPISFELNDADAKEFAVSLIAQPAQTTPCESMTPQIVTPRPLQKFKVGTLFIPGEVASDTPGWYQIGLNHPFAYALPVYIAEPGVKFPFKLFTALVPTGEYNVQLQALGCSKQIAVPVKFFN